LGDEVRLRERKLATKNPEAWMLLQRAERRRKDADSLNVAGAFEPALSALAEADSQAARAAQVDQWWPTPSVLRASVAYAKAVALRRQPALLPAVVDSGIAYADQALARDPRNADALEYKGKLLYFRITEHLTAPGDEDRTLTVAESTLTRAVEINKDQAGAWDALSALNYRKSDLGEVVRALQRAYESDAYLRSSRSILMRLALASYNLEQFPEAMRWLNELKRRFPNERYWVEMRLYMYRSKYQQPDIDSAWTYLNKYVELTPERDRPLARRKGEMFVAGALSYAGLRDSARSVLLRARTSSPEIDPRRELAAVEAGVRAIMHDDDEAIRLLKAYLTLNPEHRRGFSNRTFWWWRDLQSNPKFRAMIAGIK
jgi:tetratricopeptide (TPR) repeat protein